jgi:pimeloyl-ACP methyl ester carboxylesterase
MKEQSLWYWPGLIAVVTGLAWLAAGFMHGWGLALALLPGLIQTGAGISLLLWPGDRRIPQHLAVNCVIAVFLLVPAVFAYGYAWALVLLLLTVCSFASAGYAALHHEPRVAEVPEARTSLGLAFKVALDDALLGYFTLSARMPTGERARIMRDECELILKQEQVGDIFGYHREPSPLKKLELRDRRAIGQAYQHLSFDSGYEPHPTSLGAARWQALERNRRAHAWVLQHPGPPRPWLVCIHGYRMGMPWMDFGLFQPRWLHKRLGLNLIMPVLPLHGPRRMGLRSGDGYMDGDFPNFIHAEAQAMHDIRSQIHWLRKEQGATDIGVLGYSLGGYNAALLSCLEEGLACVIAGIPMTDITTTLWRHMPLQQLRYLDSLGMTETSVREALRVISPLAMPPKTERRYIFAGLADRLISPDQVLVLARHWQVEDIVWYAGTHLSFGGESVVSRLILRALQESGMVPKRSL